MTGAIAMAALLWFVGLEIGLLPWWIERAVVRRVGRTGAPIHSIWIVDSDRQEARRTERFHQDTRDNPTIR
jgi:hypothetical protein